MGSGINNRQDQLSIGWYRATNVAFDIIFLSLLGVSSALQWGIWAFFAVCLGYIFFAKKLLGLGVCDIHAAYTGKDIVESLIKKYKYPLTFKVSPEQNKYDIGENAVYLTNEFTGSKKSNAIGTALHELGHVRQHKEYCIINGIVDKMNIWAGRLMSWMRIGVIIGMKFSWVGIGKKFFYIYLAAILVQVYRVFTEWHASYDGIKLGLQEKIISKEEKRLVWKHLAIAGMTYVAGLALDLPLLYFLWIM